MEQAFNPIADVEQEIIKSGASAQEVAMYLNLCLWASEDKRREFLDRRYYQLCSERLMELLLEYQ